MKFEQVIEYNMRNNLLKNHTENVLEKLFTEPYLKKPKLSISLDQ